MTARARLLLLTLPLVCAACAPRTTTVAGGTNQNQLTREQFADYNTVMEAVQSLRSNWLRPRSPYGLTADRTPQRAEAAGITRELSPVWVYRDGVRVGGPEVLERLSPAEIELIEHYDASRASLRWGQNHENGVIHLTSRARE
jgi:hypothetical protein